MIQVFFGNSSPGKLVVHEKYACRDQAGHATAPDTILNGTDHERCSGVLAAAVVEPESPCLCPHYCVQVGLTLLPQLLYTFVVVV